MFRNDDIGDRRSFLTAGLTACAGAALSGTATAGISRTPRAASQGDFPVGRTDEHGLHAADMTLPGRARALIRIGQDGIARENQPALEAFFHPRFRFHGPSGAELDREGLWAYFAACRATFDDFSVTRQAVMSDGAGYMASGRGSPAGSSGRSPACRQARSS